MEENKIYSEAKKLRADTSVLFGMRMVEKSGLKADENVKVETVIGSGRIVIERMNKGGT